MLRIFALILIALHLQNNTVDLAPAHVQKVYATVVEQTVEGYTEYNDYYIVVLDDGNIHEVESDDLEVNDRVTVFFYEDEPIRTVYGER